MKCGAGNCVGTNNNGIKIRQENTETKAKIGNLLIEQEPELVGGLVLMSGKRRTRAGKSTKNRSPRTEINTKKQAATKGSEQEKFQILGNNECHTTRCKLDFSIELQ
jgi:hypothetical protein